MEIKEIFIYINNNKKYAEDSTAFFLLIRNIKFSLFKTILCSLFLLFILSRRGVTNMVDMYLALVIAGRRTCNVENKTVTLVPTRYRSLVLAELEALGLDADGNPIK